MASDKIKYVHIELDDFLTDPDYLCMSPCERGIYISLILVLYSNSGSLKFDEHTHKLCNCSNKQFENIFSKIKHKFRIKNKKIFHKKVSKVLAKQKKFLQASKKSGLKGGRPKKGTLSEIKPNENENEVETNSKTESKSKTKTNSKRIRKRKVK